jgi:predicted phosphodiesterase
MMADELPFRIEQKHPEVITIRMETTGPGWEQWFLLSADRHHDSKHCDQVLEKKHLQEALKRNAGIIDLGDAYDVMGGKGDKRFDEDELPDDLKATRKTYFDSVVNYAADFYTPYAKNWVLLASGNHEVAVLEHYQTCLTTRLADRLRTAGSIVKVGPYSGWIRMAFTFAKSHKQTFKIHWHHGWGASAPVTKGAIHGSRQLAHLDDVDLIISGHLHTTYNTTYRRAGLNNEGTPYLKDVEVIRIPSYKNSYSGGKGWAVRKGFGPEPIGAYWLRFFYLNEKIHHEIIRAK